MDKLTALYLTLLGTIDVIKDEGAKHGLLDYCDAARLMEVVGLPDAAAGILTEGGVLGMQILVAEGHDPEVLKGRDSPIVASIRRLDAEARAKRAAPDPFNGIRFPQKDSDAKA